MLMLLRTSTLTPSYLGGLWIRDSDVFHASPKYIQLPIVTRCAAILMDGLVLGITWYKTASLMTIARRLDTKVTLTTLVVRDGMTVLPQCYFAYPTNGFNLKGTIYFLLLLALNIICAIFDTLPSGNSLDDQGTFVISFQDSLSSILISRFILNLREVYTSKDQESNNPLSSVRFASQLFGVTLEPPGWEKASGSHRASGDDAIENIPAPVYVSEDPLAEGLFPRSSEQIERRCSIDAIYYEQPVHL
ncbi:hypothetical protein NLI96_g10938 [Meripilus lineatus]|uniref:Uncharacterized protein n=1 Tax=Meripilus lineatus TaxID=2056292 RepID=A0AAD5YDR5_9APHY|nr:hypothetical protein NLI96_g10938 [Physisporinus lineatus]